MLTSSPAHREKNISGKISAPPPDLHLFPLFLLLLLPASSPPLPCSVPPLSYGVLAVAGASDLLGRPRIPRRTLPSVAVDMCGAARATNSALLAGAGDYDDEDGRVLEWEQGLPSGEDLAPLSQTLITPELASAFGITPEPPRTPLDVCRASRDTISSLRRQMASSLGSESGLALGIFPSVAAASVEDPVVVTEGDESGSEEDGSGGCYDKAMRLDAVEEADSSMGMENAPSFDGSARAQKRPRLVWTSQLHRRFVDVVTYLGIKNAVPKAIMRLMNVEGLTRENVASHLQKYRLYLKRNEGLSPTPVPQRLQETTVPVPVPYAATSSVVPMRVLSMAQRDPGAHATVVPVNGQHCAVAHQGFEAYHPYTVPFEERRVDFVRGNKFCPMVLYPRVSSDER